MDRKGITRFSVETREKSAEGGGGEKVVLTKLLHLARKKKMDDELNIFSIRETKENSTIYSRIISACDTVNPRYINI